MYSITNKKLGILGGGQLAMMLIDAGRRIGITDIIVLDPNPKCSAASIGAKQIVGSYQDEDKIMELAKQVDVITIDIENVNAEALIKLEDMCNEGSFENNKSVDIYPEPRVIRDIQDKWIQKERIASHYFKDVIFTELILDQKFIPYKYRYYNFMENKTHHIGKFVLKTKKGGYDGKGVWILNSVKEMQEIMEKYNMKEDEVFIEDFIEIEKELAIVAMWCLDIDTFIHYPIVETVQKNGVCTKTICPTPLTLKQRNTIIQITKSLLNVYDTEGVFGFEFFLGKNGKIYLNEVSPRVHNTGHYTIEGTNCSQFELHLRAIMGLPFPDEIRLTNDTCVMMENIFAPTEMDSGTMTKLETGLHLYNKAYNNGDETAHKAGRKIGHRTYFPTLENVPYPLVYIVMGSISDLPYMKPAIDLLNKYSIKCKIDVVSAHRSPKWMFEFGENIRSQCAKVVIAAAGGAAHLPGMLAAITTLPVIGVPIPTKNLGGQDSLLSIVEMPNGVPVATVGIGKSQNAAILALRILGASDILDKIKKENEEKVKTQRLDLSLSTLKRFLT